jgi:hypothetical protein
MWDTHLIKRGVSPFQVVLHLQCYTTVSIKILTWWPLDELALLLLVARDDVEDAVDDVPPTGWPRDIHVFVYDEWDDPNGLWTEYIKEELKKGWSCPTTCYEGTWGERSYSSYSFSTSALDGGVSDQRRALAALQSRGKDPQYPLYRRLGGPQSQSGQRLEEKPFHLCRWSNLDRLVIQHIARHYTDWATRLTIKEQQLKQNACLESFLIKRCSCKSWSVCLWHIPLQLAWRTLWMYVCTLLTRALYE